MITQFGRFLIKHENIDLDYLANFNFKKLEEEYQRIKKIFILKEDIEKIKLCFLYDPDEFNFFADIKYDLKWAWAFTSKLKIYIFAPSVCEKYTNHKKEEIFNVLVHEMTHVLYNFCNFRNNILNEGIAYYVMGRKFNIDDIKDKKIFLNASDEYKNRIKYGTILIENIIENIEKGNEKIIKFFNETKSNKSEEEMNRIFKEIFGHSPIDLINLKGGNK
ncbi:MAG: hypothetical protein Q8N88_06865 [Nanoarchaeota archaeon]|nr:hypothetical protein [Nanoarchaeota archaeon]